ncbi:MAG: SLBB domain-containing protein, partial [Treponema sp.]|nr:SLBB domain-containing protein [Treponema sp.]
ERPGTYQLLAGENIRELIEFFGNGFTPIANSARIEMVRHTNSEDISGDRLFLTERDVAGNFALEDYDVVNVPPITQLMPVVFVEGAVGIGATGDLVTTNRLVVRFNAGETYAAMVRRNSGWFSAISDTQNAYIIRRTGEHVPIDLDRALFDASYNGEVLVHDNDTLVIPFRQFFVTVAGAVLRPGRFPFIPDRGWEYYVALAGGFTPGLNAFGSITVTDINGRRLRRGDPITPETVITARANHPMYFLAQYVTPVLAVVSTFISIMLIVRN